MIKTTMAEIIEGRAAIQALLLKEIASDTAFRLAEILKEIDSKLKTYEEQRLKIYKDYGAPVQKKNENGDLVDTGELKIRDENTEIAEPELKSLLDMEISLNYDKISKKNMRRRTKSGKEVDVDIAPIIYMNTLYIFNKD